jgi:hypothetical protein
MSPVEESNDDLGGQRRLNEQIRKQSMMCYSTAKDPYPNQGWTVAGN